MARPVTTPAAIDAQELEELRNLVEQRTGVLFDASRERLLAARVREHLQERRLAHASDLLRLVRCSHLEFEALLERLLDRDSAFFCCPDLFHALEEKVLPDLHMRKFWESPRALRVWSAGCGTGEEPYSIAITLADALEFEEAWNLSILASDISRQALQHAERGVYSRRQLVPLPSRHLENYFARIGDQFLIKPRIRNLIHFAPMNLVQGGYLGRFDCIFCMHVLSSFSPERRAALVQRFYDCLEPGGYLFLGPSEEGAAAPAGFESVFHREARFYRRPGEGFPQRAAVAAPERRL